jgi:hypothetical protein
VLDWVDGKVEVLSRLTKSPAGSSGIQKGDQLVSWREHSFNFGSKEEAAEWFKTHMPTLGEIRSYVLQRPGQEAMYMVTMVATFIQGPIPVYMALPECMCHDHRYTHGMFVDMRTGELVATATLSDRAINEVLGL